MDLTESERLALAGQYRILDKLDPKEGWSRFVEILESGFEAEYDRLADMLYRPMPKDDSRFVVNILAVYDALQRPYHEAGKDIPDALAFPGFDGNNESGLLGYFRFLLKDGRFTYLKLMFEDGNSHAPFEQGYRRMIAEWQKQGEPHFLTGEKADAVRDAMKA